MSRSWPHGPRSALRLDALAFRYSSPPQNVTIGDGPQSLFSLLAPMPNSTVIIRGYDRRESKPSTVSRLSLAKKTTKSREPDRHVGVCEPALSLLMGLGHISRHPQHILHIINNALPDALYEKH